MLMKVIVMRRSKQSNQITNNLKHITEVSKAYSKSVKSSIQSKSPSRQMTTRQNVKMSISKATKHQVPSYVSYISYLYNTTYLTSVLSFPNSLYVSIDDGNKSKKYYTRENNVGDFINCMHGIVYTSFISKCSSNNPSTNQNTSINKPNLTPGKPIDVKVSKPIPIKTTDSWSQKTRLLKKHKQEIIDWIFSIQPTHLITIQLPEHIKTHDTYKSLQHLRRIMASFENKLLGRHWNKKHLHFRGAAELGTSNQWHYHILFNQGNFTIEELETARFLTLSAQRLPNYSFNLMPLEEHPYYATVYCTKELHIKDFGMFDSSRIIVSNELFDIKDKNK
ncbi:MAG: hypothetical protein E7018_02250 [Alphaproteobacteria bacterium]|nr:hypothetical protein [Alphaproteobacteria bacterium]